MTSANENQSKTYKRQTNPTSRFDISSTIYTTQGFMANRVIYSREIAPKQHVHLQFLHQIRTAPTLQPCFGHFDCKMSAFFIPYSLIWTKWNDFITQTIRDGAKPSQVPTLSESTLADALISVLGASETGIGDTTCDLAIKDSTLSTPVTYYYTFRDYRKRNVICTLESLGYVIPRFLEKVSSDGQLYSALPLLAWDKVWYDFYKVPDCNSFPFEPDKAVTLTSSQCATIINRMKTEAISYPKSYFAHNETPDAGGSTNFHAAGGMNYAPDISFNGQRTDASTLVNLQQYNTSNVAGHATTLTTSAQGSIATGGMGQNGKGATPSLPTEQNTSTTTNMKWLTEQNLEQLAKMTDYVKRISVAGFSALKRMFAEYGIDVKDTPTNKTAQYIADYTFQINLQEVTATDGANLGQQTGASMKSRGASLVVDFCPDVFGQLIVYMNIRPKVEFIRGVPRSITMHLKPMDFWHPDFDGFGYQGTRVDEVHMQTDPVATSSGVAAKNYMQLNRSAVEGVLPTYAEYKAGFSLATGDFARKTTANTYNQYHTARVVNEATSSAPSSTALLGQLSSWSSPEDYLRIFGNYNVDPFLCHIDVEGYIDAPMRPLFDLPGEWTCDGPKGRLNGDARGHM